MKSVADQKHPPRLQLNFFKNLGILLLINIVPILGGIYILYHTFTGKMRFKNLEFLPGLLYILAFASVLIFFFWVVLPIVKWLRDYSWWHSVNRSVVIWGLPAAVSFVIWTAAVIASFIIAGMLVLVAASTFLSMLGVM
jgi:hypothetical protein